MRYNLKNRLVFIVLMYLLLPSCKKEIFKPKENKLLSDSFGMAVSHFSHARKIDVSVRHEMGVRWVRRDISWDEVERTRGNFDYNVADTVINRELEGNNKVLAILNYSNLLYIHKPNANTIYSPPDTLEFFGNYVTNTVNHFKDRIDIWEIWNEPNGPTFWKPFANPREFGKLVLLAAKKIREADPNAKIMLGGMVGNSDQIFFNARPWGFLEDLLKIYPEITDYIDIYSVHPYTFLQNPAPEEGSSFPKIGYAELLKNFRIVLDKNGAKNKPVWATELGWHTAINGVIFKGVSENLQGAYMVRACVIAISLGVDKVFPYTYCDNEFGNLTDSEANFGMLYFKPNPSENERYEPKPAYFAYKTMTEQLSNTHFVKDLRSELNLSNDIYAYQFDNTIVAWTTSLSEKTISLVNKPNTIISMSGVVTIPNSNIIKISQLPSYIK